LFEYCRQRVGDRRTAEKLTTGKNLVYHDSKGPDIGALVHVVAARLFGSHVGCGPEELSDNCRANCECGRDDRISSANLSGHCFSEAEVQYFHTALGSDFDIGGLEIAMDHPLFVRIFQCLDELMDNWERFFH